MVTSNDDDNLKASLSEEFSNEVEGTQKGENRSSSLFFLSFDLVNSTEYKSRYPKDWLKSTQDFYTGCENGMADFFPEQFTLWKKSGDEVLFYIKLNSIDDVYDSITNIYKILYSLIDAVTVSSGKGILSVKATFWTALVCSTIKNNTQNSEIRNIAISDPNGNYDFIGPDIDFGFRIASQSAPGIICIDVKIIALLEKKWEQEKTILYLNKSILSN